MVANPEVWWRLIPSCRLRRRGTSSGSLQPGGLLLKALVAQSCRLFITPWTVPTRLLCPWDFPGKNTGVDSHSLCQGIFLTQVSCIGRWILHHLNTREAPMLCYAMSDSVWPHRQQPTRVPGILQARTLEWVATSFPSAWKWKVRVKSLSHVRLLATPWTAAYQAPPPMGFSRQEYWSGVPTVTLVPNIRELLEWYSIKYWANCVCFSEICPSTSIKLSWVEGAVVVHLEASRSTWQGWIPIPNRREGKLGCK